MNATQPTQGKVRLMQYMTKTLWTLGGAGLIAIVALLWQLNETSSKNAVNSQHSLELAAQAMQTNKETVAMLGEIQRRIENNSTDIAVANALAEERHRNQ